MIDREKVIEGITQCRHNLSEMDCYECPYYTEAKGVHCYQVLLRDALALLKDQPRWIPVTEGKPFAEYGESDAVLTVDSLGVMRVACWDGGNWVLPNGNFIESTVKFPITHWMPLPNAPEPPKEEVKPEIPPDVIEGAKRNEEQLFQKAREDYDKQIAELQARIEWLKAEIAKMPPFDAEKLAKNPSTYPANFGIACGVEPSKGEDNV